MKITSRSFLSAAVTLILTACGSSGAGPYVSPGHTIGGTINITNFWDDEGDLPSYTLVLQNNAGDNLSIQINSTDSGGTKTFQFATPVAIGGDYSVTVVSPKEADVGPSNYNFCEVTANGTGTNVTEDVTSVEIHCHFYA